jgi:5'-deoxynucleotidase YfbR-like HD superfamily hydrolase
MPRVTILLSNDMIKNLKKINESSGKSISKTSAELIETGYKLKHWQESQKLSSYEKNKQKLADKHTLYLLKIMSIVGDTYRCVRNEKSRYDEEDVNDVFNIITNYNCKYIEEYLNKD